jgi:phosphatidylserine/phosphatidylglycerophosphate/cardiolipin synthase-like enzyme
MAAGANVENEPQTLPDEKLTVNPEQRRDTVLRVIRSARRRLILSVFRCSDYLVMDELAEAVSRGVRVEALLTPRAKGDEAKQLRELGTVLQGMGAEVYRYSDPMVKYHAKYMVPDDGPALVGTLNFTAKCFTNTCDFQLVTWDPGVISSLQRLFEVDCVSPESPLPEGLSERLIVGPDRSRARFTRLLEQAEKSIRIIDHKVSDPQIVALLKDKQKAGVSVEVLGSGEVGGLRSHGKMILVDDQLAAIGSVALAPLNLDFRREVAILIREPRCLSQLRGFFLASATARVAKASRAGDEEDEE